MRSELRGWLVAAALALGFAPVHAAVDAAVGAEGRLRVAVHHARVSADLLAPAKRELRLSPPLARQIAAAQEFFAVGKRSFTEGDATWILIVTETESRANHAAGACGSGTEDVLHLVQLDTANARLVERSSLPLQSCLSGLSLNDDSGRSLQESLEAATDPAHLRLTWLNHPDYGDTPRTLHVVHGAIQLD